MEKINYIKHMEVKQILIQIKKFVEPYMDTEDFETQYSGTQVIPNSAMNISGRVDSYMDGYRELTADELSTLLDDVVDFINERLDNPTSYDLENPESERLFMDKIISFKKQILNNPHNLYAHNPYSRLNEEIKHIKKLYKLLG
jgi:hypothetical protein